MLRPTVPAIAAALMLGAFFGTPAHAEGNPTAGEQIFKRCTACHTTEEGGRNRVGPNLWGVIGSTSGTRETGYNYSRSLREAEVTWADDTLDQFLENPRGFVKGTRMGFPGLKQPQEREDVIAYLKTATQ